MAKGIGVIAALALWAGAPAGGGGVARCLPTLANQLASTGSSKQLVTVVTARDSSSRGSLQLWRKSGDCWLSADGPWPAWLGQRGVSEERREGDRTTPAGVFGFGSVIYGVAADPGSTTATTASSAATGGSRTRSRGTTTGFTTSRADRARRSASPTKTSLVRPPRTGTSRSSATTPIQSSRGRARGSSSTRAPGGRRSVA
jgi:hypothetical protein